MLLHRIWPIPSFSAPRTGLLRSMCLLATTVINFLALQFLQLDQTATIFFLSPLAVAALAGPLLNEWVGWHRLIAICIGFSATLLS